MTADDEDRVCFWCGNTEELSPREREYDSAPLHGFECRECLDAEREYRKEILREVVRLNGEIERLGDKR